MKLRRPRVLCAALVLVGILFDQMSLNPFLTSVTHPSFRVLPGLLALGLAIALWIWGLDEAGRGWRRVVYLAAFAGAIVWMGSSGRDIAAGLQDGFQLGYGQGAVLAAQDRAEQGLPPRPPKPAPFAAALPQSNAGIDLLNWVVMTAILGTVLHRLQRSGERAQAQERLAVEAREQALRARLAPHFLFNTLNTLHAQIEKDPRAAQVTTERLAWLFRKVLEISQRTTIPLAEECQIVEAYLGIEQTRLSGRLKVNLDIPEDLEQCPIPPMSLQVLVENAVKHGVAPLEAGGEISVRAEAMGEHLLRLSVEDPGTGASQDQGTGTALATLRQRLRRPEDLMLGFQNGQHCVSFLWKWA